MNAATVSGPAEDGLLERVARPHRGSPSVRPSEHRGNSARGAFGRSGSSGSKPRGAARGRRRRARRASCRGSTGRGRSPSSARAPAARWCGAPAGWQRRPTRNRRWRTTRGHPGGSQRSMRRSTSAGAPRWRRWARRRSGLSALRPRPPAPRAGRARCSTTMAPPAASRMRRPSGVIR